MRLGVSPAAASTPTGVFNQRFESLFPQAGALGCAICFDPPPFLLVYLHVNVGPQGLLAAAQPAPFAPQSAKSLGLALRVYLCRNVRLQGLLVVALPALFIPQSATSLGLAALPRVLSTPAACLCPSYWSG